MPQERQSIEAHGARRAAHWWPLVVILVAAVVALTWIWGYVGEQRQDRVVATYLAASIALAALLIWLLVLSRLRWSLRLAALAVALTPLIVAVLALERRGVTGDVVPVLDWRWSERASERTLPAHDGDAAAPTLLRDVGAAGDYPQFLGPRRDGSVDGPRLAPDWEVRPPRLLWRRPMGAGWSGFAVFGPYAVTQEQRGAEEVVSCYARSSGRLVWAHAERARHEDPLGGPGPRATPTIHAGRVYALGATGRLHALELATGRLVWTVDVLADNDAIAPPYGVSASPLVFDERVVVLAGGPAGRSLVAYEAASGRRVWSGGSHPAAYSSPLAARLAATEQIVALNGSHLVGHAAGDGALLWSVAWPSGTENVSQPLILPGERVFVSTGYGVGGKLVRVGRGSSGEFEVEEVWHSRGLKAKLSNVVYRDGFLYGLDDGRLACLDATSGERVWKAGRYGHGQLILAGELLLIQAESGDVVLVRATPREHRELARLAALADKTWNHPALAGRHLLVRNDREAACFELPVE